MGALQPLRWALRFFRLSGSVLGAFGDSISTAPSYADPLALLIEAGFGEQAIGGYKTSDLIAYLKPSMTSLYSHSVLLCGINDIIQGVAAATTQANLATLISMLNNPVVVCLLPFGNYTSWDSDKEAKRVAINDWIKANADHWIDLDAALGDGSPTQPALIAEYDSGDGLHPSAAGNTRMASELYQARVRLGLAEA